MVNKRKPENNKQTLNSCHTPKIIQKTYQKREQENEQYIKSPATKKEGTREKKEKSNTQTRREKQQLKQKQRIKQLNLQTK